MNKIPTGPKFVRNVQTYNMTELSKLVNAGAKLVFRNPKKNTKPGWEI